MGSTREAATRRDEPGRSMRVCFVIPKAYPLFNPGVSGVFGGAEVDLYLLSTELATRRGWQVSCVVADYGQPPEERREGVRLIRSLSFAQSSLAGARRLWTAMRLADADVYMLETTSPGVPLAGLFCRLHGRSLVYRSAHDWDVDGTYIRQHPVAGRLYRSALRRAGAVVVQTREHQGLARDVLGVDSQIIPNGIRVEAGDREVRDRALWVGRSQAFKRPGRFLDLAERLVHRPFTMICPRASQDAGYDRLAARADRIDNVEFVPGVPFAETAGYFRRARMLISTSDSEGFPNVFLQACAAATPIVSLAVDPDGFLEETGCGVCCGDDFDRLAATVDELWDSPQLERTGQAGLTYALERHDIRRIVESYEELFQRIRGPRRGGGAS